MTELLDSELQAAWDRNQQAPPHKRMSDAELFEKFKRKEPEKKGWLSHLASGYEAQADVAPKYAGLVRNAPALAAGLATLPTYGLGTLENAVRYRGGEGQQEQYPGVSPSASFHLGTRDTGLTPEQFASGVQDFVPPPGIRIFPFLGKWVEKRDHKFRSILQRVGIL